MIRILFLCLVLATNLYGQVTVAETLKVAAGNQNFNGTVTITSPAMTYGGVVYLPGTKTVSVSNGAFTTTLWPNAGATPTNTTYRVMYTPRQAGGEPIAPWTELWEVVPANCTSPTVCTVTQVRKAGPITNPSGSPLSNPLTTAGDMIYFNTGLARLAIGSAGQVLTVSAGLPAWASQAGGVWGTITGTLSAQTDLNSALTGKEPTIMAGTTGQYWRGDKSWQTLNSTAVGLGNVENTALSTWPGSANITALGTLVSGALPWSLVTGAPSTFSWFNVKDYGAVGNGTTDDTVAIQNAVNAALATGGRVYLPTGTYLISSSITATVTGGKSLSIVGEGPGGGTGSYGTIVYNTSAGAAFDFTGDINAGRILFEKLKILGAVSATHGIVCTACFGLTIRDVYQTTATLDGLACEGCIGATIENSRFNANGRDGVRLISGAGGGGTYHLSHVYAYSNCTIKSACAGIRIDGALAVTVADSDIEGTGQADRIGALPTWGYGVWLNSVYASTVTGNYFERNITHAVGLTGDIKSFTVSGNYMESSGVYAETSVVTSGEVKNNYLTNVVNPEATITGVVDDGAGHCRITTSAAHKFTAGASVYVTGIVGATVCNGTSIVETVGSTTQVDLLKAFGGSYSSGGTAVQVPGLSIPPSANIDVSGNYSNQAYTYWSGTRLATGIGAALASASTITPTYLVHHVTGAAVISTIAVPTTEASGFAGTFCAIPDGAWTTNTSGNIAIASSAVVNQQVCWVHDPSTAKWYPSQDMAYPGAGVPNSTGSAWGTSYTVGTAANNLVQLNGTAQLPAVSAFLLTNFPTLNQDTTGTAAGLSATLPLSSGGTGNTTGTAGRCAQYSADGTKIEAAAAACGSGSASSPYSIAFSGDTTKTVTAATHGLGTDPLDGGCYTVTTGAKINPASWAKNSSGDVTITVDPAWTGTCYLHAGAGYTGGGAVSSVFGRTGAVVSTTNDYAFSQISGTAAISQGGTGATTAAAARVALFPSMTGNALKRVRVNTAATDIEYVTSTYDLEGSATLSSWGTIAAGDCVEKNITVTGAVSGDRLSVGWPNTIESKISPFMYATTDLVVVRLCNYTATGIAVADGKTFSVGINR